MTSTATVAVTLVLFAAAACEPSTPASPPAPMPEPGLGPPPDTRASHPDLVVETVVPGAGPELRYGQSATFLYTGTLRHNGIVFDSNRFPPGGESRPDVRYGEPTEFHVADGRLIKGFWLGLLGMQPGERRRITIPPHLGYGDQGQGKVPAAATLVFDVELKKILE